MKTRINGAHAAAIRDLTLGHDETWMRGLVSEADARDQSLEVCLATLNRYRTQGSSVERTFATVIAAIICATDYTTLTPAPTGAEVIAALHRGGDARREAALLSACHQLVVGQ